ncbi:MAG: AEC family transporter [Acidimicrobiia bacterium]
MVLTIGCFVGALVLAHLVPATRHLAPWLERYVLWFALPAVVLVRIPAMRLAGSELSGPLVAWACMGVGCGTIALLRPRMGWSDATFGALLLTTALGNTSFIGFPLIEWLRGGHALGPAVVYDQFGSFLGITVLGTIIGARYGTADRQSWLRVIKAVVTFPPFLALLAALVMRAAGWHAPFHAALGRIGSTQGYVALAAIGLRFMLRVPRGRMSAAAVCIGLKMVIIPACAVAVVRGLNLSPVIGLEAAMPPMATAAIVAARTKLDGELASFVVGTGLILAIATLPLWNLILA